MERENLLSIKKKRTLSENTTRGMDIHAKSPAQRKGGIFKGAQTYLYEHTFPTERIFLVFLYEHTSHPTKALFYNDSPMTHNPASSFFSSELS